MKGMYLTKWDPTCCRAALNSEEVGTIRFVSLWYYDCDSLRLTLTSYPIPSENGFNKSFYHKPKGFQYNYLIFN